MSTAGFYRVVTDETGRTSYEAAQRIAGPGWALDAATLTDHPRTVGGWKYYESEALFLASAEARAAQAAMWRTRLEDKGVDLDVLSDDTPDGAAWVQPLGVIGCYAEGAVVTHAGKRWVSLLSANVWEPGVSGWRELPTGGTGPAAWVQPTGAHDAYKKGDRVTYDGRAWTSTIDGNIWAPGVYGWSADA